MLPSSRRVRRRRLKDGEIEESVRQKMEYEPAEIGKPVELKAGECMFHHCLNFHATPANVTTQQRRAHVMIFMADGVTSETGPVARPSLDPEFCSE